VYAIPQADISGPEILPVPEWVFTSRAEKLDRFAVGELDGLPVRRLTYEGDAAEQIVTTAKTEAAQLIVMPTHGYGIFRKFLLGSITAKVLHDIEGPVLTGAHVRQQTGVEPLKISHVVCAVAMGSHSADTVTWAANVARDFGSTLTIVHVIPRLDPALRVVVSSAVDEEFETTARQEIHKLLTNVGASNSMVCVRRGDVAQSVCEYTKSVGADLLIIGRRQKDAEISQIRPNAYEIIRQSHCPVLSV